MGEIRGMNKKGVSRRDFIVKSAAAGGAVMVGGSTAILGSTQADQASPPSSSKPSIELAGYDYDRVQALVDGRVQIEGCATQFELSSIGEMNINDFFNQAAEYENGGDILDSVHKLLNMLWQSHPFPVLRLSG